MDTAQTPPVKDGRGRAPLHLAVDRGREEAAERLLRAGVDPSTADDEGATPLHLAAYRGHAGLARLLLDWRADVNARDRNGETPLAWVPRSEEDRRAVAQVLRKVGGREK